MGGLVNTPWGAETGSWGAESADTHSGGVTTVKRPEPRERRVAKELPKPANIGSSGTIGIWCF